MLNRVPSIKHMGFTLTRGIRIRDFEPYRRGLGDSFVAKMVFCWEPFGNQYSDDSERSYWHHVTTLFGFLVGDPSCANLRKFLRGEIRADHRMEYLLWQEALTHFRDHIDRLYDLNITKDNLLSGSRKFLCDYCANEGVVPHDLSLSGFEYELGLGSGSTALDDRTLSLLGQSEESLAVLIEQLDDEDVDLDKDVIELLSELAGQVSEEGGSLNRVDFATTLLESRISALKDTAAQVYFEYIKATRILERWANDPLFVAKAKALDALFNNPTTSNAKKRGIQYSNILDGCALEVLSVWVCLINGRRYLLDSDSRYRLFHTRLKKYGLTRDDIELHIGSSRRGLVAGYAFILLETAGNTMSIWNLKTYDLVLNDGSQDSYRLNWIKQRSHSSEAKSMRFRTRMNEVSAKTITVKDVFEHQLKCRTIYLSDVREMDKDQLFIALHKNNTKTDPYGARQYVPTHPTRGFISSHFKELCQSASSGKWSTTPKAIRGSRLLLKGILSRDASAVAELGQHQGLAMAKRYTYHLPEVLRREQNIRDFLDWFEALLTVDIDQFAKKLELDEAHYARRAKNARNLRKAELESTINTQFGGIHCRDPSAGVQPGTSKGKICTRVDKCPTCMQRRGLFVLSQANLANVMHWHQTLEGAKSSLSEDTFKPWVIWHLFTSMVLQRFSQNPAHAALFRLADKQQQQEPNPYSGLIPLFEVTA